MGKAACALLLVLLLLFAACTAPQPQPGAGGSTRRQPVLSGELQFTQLPQGAPTAVLETSRGNITVALYPQQAPLAVENFCRLAQQGYYNATIFHRVVQGFVVQGGDGTGTGLSGESIWGAPFQTERSELLHHYTGALCMATAENRLNTHLSQFYIVSTPQNSLSEEALAKMLAAGMREEVVNTYRQAGGTPYLDYTTTVFGQVIDGMDVVDAIAAVPLDENGRPKSEVSITGVSINNYFSA